MQDMEVATRKASHRAPILSLVDREYLKSTANIPQALWEPMSYLYSEADQSMARVKAMDVPADLEWERESCLQDWHQFINWLDEILLQSQSVDALRSWQLMGGLQGMNPQQRPSANVVMPDYPQPQPPSGVKKRNGILRRNGEA